VDKIFKFKMNLKQEILNLNLRFKTSILTSECYGKNNNLNSK